jgi:hypothetical protein
MLLSVLATTLTPTVNIDYCFVYKQICQLRRANDRFANF